MGTDEYRIVDWVHLPAGTNEVSLWSTLHDGDLLEIESDLLVRTITLRFDVGYLRDFYKFSEETRFVIVVGGVQSVRSFNNVPWPGGCSIPPGTPYEQQRAIVAEYQSKWREESQTWGDFERLISAGLQVSDATLAQSPEGVALRFGLMVADDSYVEAFIRGEKATFQIGQRQVTVSEFVEAGETYWEAFASKSKRK